MKTRTNITCPAIALFALACFALSPTVRAVLPAPSGGYPGQNTADGDDALFSLTTGVSNTAIGFEALFSNTYGLGNTAVGDSALAHNTSGIDNTALGEEALDSNTDGFGNVAIGSFALLLSTANENTAIGFSALGLNTIGNQNTAIGFDVLSSNTTGYGNTATGYDALVTNSTGSNNTANGTFALSNNIRGDDNTATGFDALASNTTGSNNTANGFDALASNRAGNSNTASGHNALRSNTTGSFNIAVGPAAGSRLTTGSNNIDIANQGVAAEGSTIRIGTTGTQTNTYIAGISGATVAGGVGVIVDTNGHLGTVVSSERFKDSIKPMANASESILALQPVTFRYKHELDPSGIPQFGLVAEEVEKVNSALVARDEEGKAYTVRYDAVNAMLLNEFLKEHKAFVAEQHKVEEQGAMIAQQQKQIEALIAGLQKVSAQLEARKPAPQVVKNP